MHDISIIKNIFLFGLEDANSEGLDLNEDYITMQFSIGCETPLEEIEGRIYRLQSEMAVKNLEAILIIQNADLFYFTGTIQQSHLYIPAIGKPLLMVRRSFRRAQFESPLNDIVPISNISHILSILRDYGYPLPTRLGLELDVMPVQLFHKYKSVFGDTKLMDASSIIRRLRSVKSNYEIELISKACQLSDKISNFVPTVLRAGISEVELAGLIEAEARKIGHHGLIRMRSFNAELFYGQLMSGPMAALPTFMNAPLGGGGMSPALAQSASQRIIDTNESIVVDYVFGWQGYLSDHARIYCLGELSQEMKSAHKVMLEIQSMLIEDAVPGVSCRDLYENACTLVRKEGLIDHFMGQTPNNVGFIGHGIGLEVDELPVLGRGQDMLLQRNMIIAIEPKAVFKDKGTVGVENMFRVGAAGLERLTNAEDDIWTVNSS